MKNTTHMGLNYTGVQMSPIDSQAQLEVAEKIGADIPGSSQKLAELRTEHAAEAGSVGSVPLPGSAKGMLKTALNKLVGISPEILIDKLGERLAFERSGVRMYEAVMAKAASIEPLDAKRLVTLKRLRDEEHQHMSVVTDALNTLGADPTAMTPCADVIGVISMGVLQTVTDPRTNLAQCLNAVLTAELTDNAGWEMLIELADTCGQPEMAQSFAKPLEQEQNHLQTIRTWLTAEVARQV